MDQHSIGTLDLDPHWDFGLDTDPHETDADPKHCNCQSGTVLDTKKLGVDEFYTIEVIS
jgi:hypothetical protein